jgi:hypothetical protein
MSKHLTRRVEVLERRAAARPAPPPCFVMAEDEEDAERAVARIRAAHPKGCRTVFVMTRGRREPGRPADGSA